MTLRKKITTAALAILMSASLAHAVTPTEQAQNTIDKGLKFLQTKQQENGSWASAEEPPAISAIVLKAFVGDEKFTADTPFIAKGYDHLLTFQQPDGGIYKDGGANYNTAISISSLAAAKNEKYTANLDKAVAYLKRLQWNEAIDDLPKNRMNVDQKDVRYGGFGYGRHSRPDGSNLQIALDALKDAGVKPEDPAFKAAVVFLTRQQNLSETNDQPWAGNDGGFVYTPAGGKPDAPGESPAGEYTGPDGKRMLRSYGSMTYAGLKSMIYAGLSKDDPRVKAGWAWIGKNWTLDENPGMKIGDPANAEWGLFYYYMTLGRALHAYGDPVITDAQGNKHDWRVELIAKLSSSQEEDGSWAGNKKWMEDNPVLVTSYCILAMQEALADLKANPAK